MMTAFHRTPSSCPSRALHRAFGARFALAHPAHCQALFEEAQRAGVDARRGVEVTEITLGARPQVTFTEGAHVVAASGRIIVGADGRNSQVREAAGISLHQDRPHHFMGGILVEDAYGWDERLQGQGAGDGFYFFAFPQGSGGYGRTAASL
jgi:menaquinone-9 beta-reductase